MAFCGLKSIAGIALADLKYLDIRSDPAEKCPYGEGQSDIGDLYGAVKLENV